MRKNDFARLLESIIKGRRIPSEEMTDLILFIGSDESTAAQRSGLTTALGIWYLRRFQ